MRIVRLVSAFLLLSGLLFAGSKPQTFTGTVSDAMCGAKHMMPGNPAECTRACIKNGSAYALVVGDKVYTLDADASQKDALDKLAGESATVSGSLDGNTIKVASVSAKK